MKKKNLNFLLALLAALALVFAGACSDGSDDTSGDTSGTEQTDTTSGSDGTVYCTTCTANTCTVTTDCTGKPGCSACDTAKCECSDCAKIEINMTYFKAFVESLGTVDSNVMDAYWSFSGGSWAEGELTYTLDGTNSSNSTAISASEVKNKVQALQTQTSSDGLLEVDFSSADWENNSATGTTPGQIKVTVTLTDDAGTEGTLAGTYTIDTNDTSLNDLSGEGVEVTLVFDASKLTSAVTPWS